MTDQSRQPGGIPAGGEFASKTHAEPDIELAAPAAPMILPPHLIDYLSGFGDGEEVTISDVEVYFAERYEQAGLPAPGGEDDGDLERHVDLTNGRSVNVKVTGEGLIVDVFDEGEVVATSCQAFEDLADLTEENDPSLERAEGQLRSAKDAVLAASSAHIASEVRSAASNAAVVVAVVDDEFPGVVYLSEVRDADGETLGERFDDQWVSDLDDSLRELLGNASELSDRDLRGGEIITLDLSTLIWSV